MPSAAGFILTGRTNTPEFGSITVTENRRFGATRNPWNPAHTPGGSSGGAGSAVAAGMFPVAHASDGGGSIRIPASCCGLVGLKPSRGRVPATVPGWQGMTTDGALARTVADSAAVLDVISAPDPYAWWNARRPARPFAEEVGADPGPPAGGPRARSRPWASPWPSDPWPPWSTPAGCSRRPATRSTLLDADVFDPAALGPFLNVVNSGAAEIEGLDWDRVEPHNQASRRAARRVDSLAFVAVVAPAEGMSRAIVARFDDEFDLLVTPTMTIEPPEVGLLEAVHAGAGDGHPAHGDRGHGRLHRRLQHHRPAGRQPASPRGPVGSARRGADRGRTVA